MLGTLECLLSRKENAPQSDIFIVKVLTQIRGYQCDKKKFPNRLVSHSSFCISSSMKLKVGVLHILTSACLFNIPKVFAICKSTSKVCVFFTKMKKYMITSVLPLRRRNTGHKNPKLVAQHCCVSSFWSMFLVFHIAGSTCRATKTFVAG